MIVIFLASLLGFGHAPGLEVEYLKNYDGDTMTVNIPGWHGEGIDVVAKKIKIRFLGVDTPEILGKCQAEKDLALEAREFVRKFMEQAEEIRLRQVGRGSGRGFRLVGRPFVKLRDGRWVDVVEEIIASGLGRSWTGRREPWCPKPP